MDLTVLELLEVEQEVDLQVLELPDYDWAVGLNTLKLPMNKVMTL